MSLPLRSCQSQVVFDDWVERWNRIPDHQLGLRDYVGPFPVGPVGYRAAEVEELRERFDRACAYPARAWGPVLDNPFRPDLLFRGHPHRFSIMAFDPVSEEPLARMSPLGTFCEEPARGRGITSEFHWLLHAAGSKAYSVSDFSRAGFFARVKAHGLILNRLRPEQGPIPLEALEGYAPSPRGGVALRSRPDPEEWNESWGIYPDPEGIEAEAMSP